MKTYKIKLLNLQNKLDITIDCPSTTTILDAAEINGVELPFACRSGSCSACVAKLLEGRVSQSEQNFLNKEQTEMGYILTCVSYPLSNIKIFTNEEENLY